MLRRKPRRSDAMMRYSVSDAHPPGTYAIGFVLAVLCIVSVGMVATMWSSATGGSSGGDIEIGVANIPTDQAGLSQQGFIHTADNFTTFTLNNTIVTNRTDLVSSSASAVRVLVNDTGAAENGTFNLPSGTLTLNTTSNPTGFNYSQFLLGQSATLTLVGDNPAIIRVTGLASINGTILLNGSAGGNASGVANASPGGSPGMPGPGGYRGGFGGNDTGSFELGTAGSGTGGGGGGPGSGFDRGGGGAGHIVSGGNAHSASNGGAAYSNAQLEPITGGSGGGGGSSKANTGGGAAAGSGGGALRLTAQVIAIRGNISADGGNGGYSISMQAGDGGGGSGGAIRLSSTVLLIDSTANLSARGGIGGTDAGNGSVGIIRVDSESSTITSSAITPAINYTSPTQVISRGNLTSPVLNSTLANVQWGRVTWNDSSSATARLWIRTDSSDDMSGATAWESLTAVANGADLSAESGVNDNETYIQYRVELVSTNATETPIIEEVKITYSDSCAISNAGEVNLTTECIQENAEIVITGPINVLSGAHLVLNNVNASISNSGGNNNIIIAPGGLVSIANSTLTATSQQAQIQVGGNISMKDVSLTSLIKLRSMNTSDTLADDLTSVGPIEITDMANVSLGNANVSGKLTYQDTANLNTTSGWFDEITLQVVSNDSKPSIGDISPGSITATIISPYSGSGSHGRFISTGTTIDNIRLELIGLNNVTANNSEFEVVTVRNNNKFNLWNSNISSHIALYDNGNVSSENSTITELIGIGDTDNDSVELSDNVTITNTDTSLFNSMTNITRTIPIVAYTTSNTPYDNINLSISNGSQILWSAITNSNGWAKARLTFPCCWSQGYNLSSSASNVTQLINITTSTPINYTASQGTPGAPSLDSPENNSRTLNSSLRLYWTPGTPDPEGDPVSFYFQLSDMQNFSTLLYEGSTTGNYSIIMDLNHSSRYYWRIIATDGKENVSSVTYTFSARGAPNATSFQSNSSNVSRNTSITITAINVTDIDNENVSLTCGSNVTYRDYCNTSAFIATTTPQNLSCTINGTQITTPGNENSTNIYCYVYDDVNQSGYGNITIFADAKLPTLYNISPEVESLNSSKFINTTGVNLTFNATENATCRWSLRNVSYQNMGSVPRSGVCTTSDNLRHNCTITDMYGGNQSVFIGCKDLRGTTPTRGEVIELIYGVNLTRLTSHSPYTGITVGQHTFDYHMTYNTTSDANCTIYVNNQSIGNHTNVTYDQTYSNTTWINQSGIVTTSASCRIGDNSTGTPVYFNISSNEITISAFVTDPNFDGKTTSIASIADLRNVINFTVENSTRGLAYFLEPVDISQGFNFTEVFDIQHNSIFVNDTLVPGLNVSANITFLNSINGSWVVEKDGEPCPDSICNKRIKVDFNGSLNNTFMVAHFTNYSIVPYVPPAAKSSDLVLPSIQPVGGSGGAGGGGGGGIFTHLFRKNAVSYDYSDYSLFSVMNTNQQLADKYKWSVQSNGQLPEQLSQLDESTRFAVNCFEVKRTENRSFSQHPPVITVVLTITNTCATDIKDVFVVDRISQNILSVLNLDAVSTDVEIERKEENLGTREVDAQRRITEKRAEIVQLDIEIEELNQKLKRLIIDEEINKTRRQMEGHIDKREFLEDQIQNITAGQVGKDVSGRSFDVRRTTYQFKIPRISAKKSWSVEYVFSKPESSQESASALKDFKLTADVILQRFTRPDIIIEDFTSLNSLVNPETIDGKGQDPSTIEGITGKVVHVEEPRFIPSGDLRKPLADIKRGLLDRVIYPIAIIVLIVALIAGAATGTVVVTKNPTVKHHARNALGAIRSLPSEAHARYRRYKHLAVTKISAPQKSSDKSASKSTLIDQAQQPKGASPKSYIATGIYDHVSNFEQIKEISIKRNPDWKLDRKWATQIVEQLKATANSFGDNPSNNQSSNSFWITESIYHTLQITSSQQKCAALAHEMSSLIDAITRASHGLPLPTHMETLKRMAQRQHSAFNSLAIRLSLIASLYNNQLNQITTTKSRHISTLPLCYLDRSNVHRQATVITAVANIIKDKHCKDPLVTRNLRIIHSRFAQSVKAHRELLKKKQQEQEELRRKERAEQQAIEEKVKKNPSELCAAEYEAGLQAIARKDFAAAIEHLRLAERAKPNDLRVQSRLTALNPYIQQIEGRKHAEQRAKEVDEYEKQLEEYNEMHTKLLHAISAWSVQYKQDMEQSMQELNDACLKSLHNIESTLDPFKAPDPKSTPKGPTLSKAEQTESGDKFIAHIMERIEPMSTNHAAKILAQEAYFAARRAEKFYRNAEFGKTKKAIEHARILLEYLDKSSIRSDTKNRYCTLVENVLITLEHHMEHDVKRKQQLGLTSDH